MLSTWRKYRNVDPVGKTAIRKEHIWFNDRIRAETTHLNRRTWEETGIVTIGDLCHESEDRLLSHTEIATKYSLPCSFLDALSLRMSIPMGWSRCLTRDWHPDQDIQTIDLKLNDDEPPKNVANISAKEMYGNIVGKMGTQRAAREKWRKGDDGIQIVNHTDWTAACERIYTSTRETKIESFQFKLLHRIVPCRTFLKQIRIVTSDECPFCGQKDSIIHFFFKCGDVTTFWKTLCAWFRRTDEVYMEHISPTEFLFGIPQEYNQSSITNTVLIYVKYYIHRQKLFYEGKMDFLQWLQELCTCIFTCNTIN